MKSSGDPRRLDSVKFYQTFMSVVCSNSQGLVAKSTKSTSASWSSERSMRRLSADQTNQCELDVR